MNNIVLVGFMAVGKTTVGKALKEILGFALWDIDRTVEQKAGKTIAEIFAQDGEAHFRVLEKEVAEMVLARNNNIISAGGGLFMNDDLRALCLKDNFVVFIDLNLKVVHERVNRNDKRPLAKGKSLGELKQLYEKRLPYYKEATYWVSADGLESKEVARRIADAYFRWLNKEL